MISNDVTEDRLLGGRITVRQPAQGYRVNVDTILLAAAVDPAPGARVMEAGCGVGAALIGVRGTTNNAAAITQPRAIREYREREDFIMEAS